MYAYAQLIQLAAWHKLMQRYKTAMLQNIVLKKGNHSKIGLFWENSRTKEKHGVVRQPYLTLLNVQQGWAQQK